MSNADKNHELGRLKVSPPVAWPTLMILVTALAAIALTWALTPTGIWPLWLGMLVNSIAGYALFTPAHEAIHRAAAQKPEHNDFILAAATFVAVPFGKGKLFRLLHMRHHRFANDPDNDPDHWMASSLWTMPLWGLWPYFYLYKFLRNPSLLPNVQVREVLREILVAAVIFAALTAWSPFYMLTLWLIPTYFAFFLMCLVFMVLPHYPHTGRQDENPNTTALMRMGQEWWLTPVLMYQNYHLIHHLYPTIPFYRYGRAWKAREAWHREHSGSMIIGPFDLGPQNRGESAGA
ncbi:fatty acid desaturase [Alcanivorax hongdengensis A-11-3]|uniref:Fatty acid desaturase n=1 Tax=Alcanivorax hongdengensis A-11-3 TaxID=1177179 RepID=L0WDE4_9GAMM|nr:fatty acid desaturase [Alcanivorax hongdengensis]EKF73795.1 fatty acid desaturase [Alcanivorax hongdengensis A-11-3]